MLKRILLVLLLLTIVVDAKNIVRMKSVETGNTREEAVVNAHWYMFKDAIDKVLGSSSYTGNVIDAFKSDMEKDFPDFKRTYFRNAKTKCKEIPGEGFECLVLASIDIDNLKAQVSQKANSSTTMGKDDLEGLDIVFVDNVASSLSDRFSKDLQKQANDNGVSLRVEKKGTPVGKKGNSCKELEQQYKLYKRKGPAYRKAVAQVESKLEKCKDNANTQFLLTLKSLDFHVDSQKDRYGSYNGELTYSIDMKNSQTGRSSSAITSETVTSYADSINKLKSNLNKAAAVKANSDIISNILKSISKKSRQKRNKKVRDKYENYYTVIIRGVTSDADDRNKLKIIRKAIKSFGAKPKKNFKESKDFEQVYNFGSNDEIDLEDFSDTLYDIAESNKFTIRVEEQGDNIVVVQFQ